MVQLLRPIDVSVTVMLSPRRHKAPRIYAPFANMKRPQEVEKREGKSWKKHISSSSHSGRKTNSSGIESMEGDSNRRLSLRELLVFADLHKCV